MIAKDLDPFESSDPRELAGRAAEEQMAFYLKRRFQDDPDVWVFNGLRFEYHGIFTQIDHLLLTTWGFFVVESKSVTTSVKVNDRGEWMRQVDGAWKGMASPIEQASEQLRQLIWYLADNASRLLSKLIGLQRGYGGFHRGVYCAVSDNGIIERAAPQLCPEAMKADQIARNIAEKIADLKSRAGFKAFFKPTMESTVTFTPEDLVRTEDFLLSVHAPREVPAPSAQVAVPAPELSSNVLILPGTDAPAKPVESPKNGHFCSKCGCGISLRVAQFCWNNKGRFSGRAYCMPCQKVV